MADNNPDSQYPHIAFVREELTAERKPRRGFGHRPLSDGNRAGFGSRLRGAADTILQQQQEQTTRVHGIQPHLVFRMPLTDDADPEQVEARLRQAGLRVVSIESDGAIIVFRQDEDLTAFRAAIDSYEAGPRINPKTQQPYASSQYDVLQWIRPEGMRLWSRSDRIGERLLELIVTTGGQINPERSYTVDVELWHPGNRQGARDALDEVQALINSGGNTDNRILDRFVGDSLLLVKVAVTGSLLDQLLGFSIVAEADLPPVAELSVADVQQTSIRDFPTPPTPPSDGPRLCVIDSGITSNHPLLGPNVGDEAAILTGTSSLADTNGHGTMVAGIAVYGDVRTCYENRQFTSPITLFSARVLNKNNEFDNEKLIINQMNDAIVHFSRPPYDCRVFNVSIGSKAPALQSVRAHQTKWAEALDILARTHQVLIVVSSGNHQEAHATKPSDAEDVLNGYPELLFRPTARLCDPATSALALTVGGLVQYDQLAKKAPTNPRANDLARPVAQRHQPSPMTRTGPGLNGAIKPEFAHYAGNYIFQGMGNSYRKIDKDDGTSVMSLSHLPQSGLFAFDVGTSFAAPQVARIAALLEHDLRKLIGTHPHPNLVRALLANSAQVPEELTASLARSGGEHAVFKVCGYGMPNEALALHSSESRVTMYSQDRIHVGQYGDIHVLRVPMPESFRLAKGRRMITIALAYDPPVYQRRYDYFGIEMDMILIRGKTIEEICAVYSRPITNAESEGAKTRYSFGSPYQMDLKPGASSKVGGYNRGKSTLQRGVFTINRATRQDYGDDCFLVIRARRTGAPQEISEQDYAVAITLEATVPELYSQVREQIQQRAQVRVRV